jgi:hypothetical protein
METESIQMKVADARRLYRKYKEHAHYSTPIDDEIRRAYQLLAQGRLVIRALESIRLAGVDDDGLPKLAIVRADAEMCYFTHAERRADARFSSVNGWSNGHWHRHHIHMPRGSFPGLPDRPIFKAAEAVVPLVPIHLRPKRGLANYHVLWEAEWQPVPPIDPMLLRRIGRADMWVVVAMWNLTEVERAALAARVNG